ncbi:MAG TPA: hypothetical protein VFS21_29885 [Roseiflexaceae bacterium]|nr:hypothetical protein [Roseiflexaceae bacterium]
MAAIYLNGTPFNPSKVAMKLKRVGAVLTSASGTETVVLRTLDGTTPIVKREYTFSWETATEATRAAVENLARLSGGWTYAPLSGASRTVQARLEDYSDETAFITSDGTPLYRVTFTVREV